MTLKVGVLTLVFYWVGRIEGDGGLGFQLTS